VTLNPGTINCEVNSLVLGQIISWLRQHFWGQFSVPGEGIEVLSARLFIDEFPGDNSEWEEELLLTASCCVEAEEMLVLLADIGTVGRVYLVVPHALPLLERKRLLQVARIQRQKEMWVYW
jgi:hypothetical protein